MTDRQHVVKTGPETADLALATFIADVVELAGEFRRRGEEIAQNEGQTQTRWYALSVFSDGPMTVAHAARRLGTTRQALQRTANDLLKSGLVASEANPDHRGSPFVVLTAEGSQVLERITTAAQRSRSAWISDQDIAALDATHREVRRLRDLLRDV